MAESTRRATSEEQSAFQKTFFEIVGSRSEDVEEIARAGDIAVVVNLLRLGASQREFLSKDLGWDGNSVVSALPSGLADKLAKKMDPVTASWLCRGTAGSATLRPRVWYFVECGNYLLNSVPEGWRFERGNSQKV